MKISVEKKLEETYKNGENSHNWRKHTQLEKSYTK